MFKDEADGGIITEVVALRPKTYCYDKIKYNDVNNIVYTDKRAKGIPKKCAKNFLTSMYRDTLYSDSFNRSTESFNVIRSINQQLFSMTLNKSGISNNDNKRYWIDNLVSVPYGHYSINSIS